MGRVVVSEFVSVDGFYADKGGVTWQDFESYWPRVRDDPAAPDQERVVGAVLERIPKVVFSGTLDAAGWRTTVRPAVTAEALRDRADGDVTRPTHPQTSSSTASRRCARAWSGSSTGRSPARCSA